jgi:hypothetical protein
MSLVVHLVSLKVNLWDVIHDLIPLLSATKELLQPRLWLGRLLRLLLLLLWILTIDVEWTRLPLLVRGDELLLWFPSTATSALELV